MADQAPPQAEQAAPPGYPPQGQPGYPPQGQPGYPPPGQPGYPPPGQPGYPPPGQPGYPPPGQPGYPPPGQPGYPPPGQPGYPPPGQPGYPPPGQPGYPPPGQPGYPPPEQPGYPPPGQPGYPPPAPVAAGGVPPGQKAAVQWMAAPQAPVGCPPGLEYLTQIDQILVHQQIELFEVISGWETANKYQIKNSLGQQVYFAAEDSTQCQRQYCGGARSFDMAIVDNANREVIHIQRPFRGCCHFCCCCSQQLQVESPPGTVIGYVQQEFNLIYPNFTICNAEDQVILKIKGPFCTGGSCGQTVDFQVYAPDGEAEVGKISKQWSGIQEFYTDADNFGITFPMDLDVKMKAVLIAATFLIDFMYYEKSTVSD